MFNLSRIAFVYSLALLAACSNSSTTSDEKTDTTESSQQAAPATRQTILFFGNSLTAGYGVEQSEAFPALVQQKIDSAKLPYTVINGGVSGETTAGGRERIDFVLKQQKVDVFVLELGANDGLRGLPLDATRANLQEIINKVKQAYPDVRIVLAGMQIPPNMGASYAGGFQKIYSQLAEANDIALIPFLLEGVGGEARLNQSDGIHPTPEGHRILAGNVWTVLKEVLTTPIGES